MKRYAILALILLSGCKASKTSTSTDLASAPDFGDPAGRPVGIGSSPDGMSRAPRADSTPRPLIINDTGPTKIGSPFPVATPFGVQPSMFDSIPSNTDENGIQTFSSGAIYYQTAEGIVGDAMDLAIKELNQIFQARKNRDLGEIIRLSRQSKSTIRTAERKLVRMQPPEKYRRLHRAYITSLRGCIQQMDFFQVSALKGEIGAINRQGGPMVQLNRGIAQMEREKAQLRL